MIINICFLLNNYNKINRTVLKEGEGKSGCGR